MLNLEAQAYFDPIGFDPEVGYKTLDQRDSKVRHIQLHVAKAALKLSRNSKSTVVQEVIPDCAIYRSQLINLGSLAIPHDKAFQSQEFLKTLQGWRKLSDTQLHYYSLQNVVEASGFLASYIERLEHGAPSNSAQVEQAAVDLHHAASRLAFLHDVDLSQAHISRLDTKSWVGFAG